MNAHRLVRRALRRGGIWLLRTLVPSRVLFRLFGIPAGTSPLPSLRPRVVHPRTSKRVPPPRTLEPVIHPNFQPSGANPFHRASGWFFEHSLVVSVRGGVSRATGASFTSSGHVIDLGPGLTPPPSVYETLYRPLRPRSWVDDSVVTLTTYWDSNYFHWLFDVLPRLALAEDVGLKPRWVYTSLQHNFQKDTLLRLGYPPEMIIDSRIVPDIRAAELIVPSLPGIPGNIPEWVCRFLRNRLVSATIRGNGPQRIYISRAGAQSRRIVNERHVEALLERYGFMVVQLEQMSFADQMQLFESAACIVAPHGAGLANLVFCKTDTSVIEIFPPAPVNVCYWLLSQQVSLLYHYILGEPDSPGPDIRVDLNKLEHTVDLALASMPSHR